MVLAQLNPSRRQSSLHQAFQSHQQQQPFPRAQHVSIPSIPLTPQQPHAQPWAPISLPLTPQPQATFPANAISNNINFNFGSDQILFDFQPQQFSSNQSQSQTLMQSDQSNNSWMSNGQLTPTSTTRPRHHRESSLSSLGSPAGPASPFAPTTSNPQVAGESYHDFHDFAQTSSKPLTPAHTPLQDQFLSPHYQNFYQNPSSLAYTMSQDGLPRQLSNSNELLASAEFSGQGPTRPSLVTVASSDSQSTPPSCEDERQKSGMNSSVDAWLNEYLLLSEFKALRSTMPKLDRTMTDIYADELYNPNFSITSAPPSTPASAVQTAANMSPRNDVFTQRLQAANSQHLSANNQMASALSPRERSPFRQGSPLAPSAASFNTQSPNMRFGTATHLREQQKAENDARALQQQFERTSQESSTPKTISPKDVDLVYHESDEDANMPLFPPSLPRQRRSPAVYKQPVIAQEPSESEETSASQQSFRSMATTRRESSSAYSTSSHTTPQQAQYNFATPAVPGSIQRPVPQLQQYPFVSQAQRQSSNMSSVGDDFPAALTSMESSSSSSEYTSDTKSPQQLEIKKPQQTTADTGTYTCTYHGCTLRFETPQKLQKHKREGHRNSASASLIGSTGVGGGENRGMTSAAQKLNSQSGPHKCERINPSTGKPCNTIFSRPYDLTRHEDTIHNTRKQKLRCELCTEEKTFSRNDALTRHMRVVHPEVPIHIGKGRRRGAGVSMG